MVEQKQYGSTVQYVRNGVTLHALVLSSAMVPVTRPGVQNEFQRREGLFVPAETTVEEHLTLVYLDPAFANASMGSTTIDRAVARAINVPQLQVGGTNGWIEVAVQGSAGVAGVAHAAPSADDLDAAAKELEIKQATAPTPPVAVTPPGPTTPSAEPVAKVEGDGQIEGGESETKQA